jgi:hypothetical protein
MNRKHLLTVALDESDDVIVARHLAVLAGLADHWRIHSADPDVSVVFGSHSDWPLRADAALAAGVRGVLITRPIWTSRAAVRALAAKAAAAGNRIVIESAFLADPSWKKFVPTLREHAPDTVLIDSLRTVPSSTMATSDGQDLGAHCLEQVAIVQTVVGPISEVMLGEQTTEQYALSAEPAGRLINVIGVRSGAASDQLTLDLIGLARRWRVRFDNGAVARPTTVEMMDASGIHAAPLTYETGLRGTWLELHEAITVDGSVSYDLALFDDCLRVFASVAPEDAAGRASDWTA